MSDEIPQATETTAEKPRYETDEQADKRFLGWRLVGIILGVVVVLALISFVVDWMVIGPLEGRVF
jgi:hypothetical protein